MRLASGMTGLAGKRFARRRRRGLLRLPLEIEKQCIEMTDEPFGMAPFQEPAQRGMETGLHDAAGDAAIRADQVDQVPFKGRKALARRRQIKNGVKRLLQFRSVGARDVGQDVTEVRMDAQDNKHPKRQLVD